MGISLIAQAQRGQAPEQKMNDYTPEQQAVLKTKKMALHLDLNKEQQDQLLVVNRKWAEKRAEEKAKMKALKDKDEKPDADARYAHRSLMLDNQMMYQNDLKKILNKEQYVTWKEHRAQKHEKMHQGRQRHGKRQDQKGEN